VPGTDAASRLAQDEAGAAPPAVPHLEPHRDRADAFADAHGGAELGDAVGRLGDADRADDRAGGPVRAAQLAGVVELGPQAVRDAGAEQRRELVEGPASAGGLDDAHEQPPGPLGRIGQCCA